MFLTATLDRIVLGLSLGIFDQHGEFHSFLRIAAGVATYGIAALFLWASFSSSSPWRMLYWLGFTLATFVEYGYVSAIGQVTSPSDFSVAFQNSVYWQSMIVLGVNWWAAVLVVVYGVALVFAPSGYGRYFMRFVTVCVITVGFHTAILACTYVKAGYLRYVVMARATSVTGTTQAFARAGTAYGWSRILDYILPPKHLPLAYRSPTIPTTHIVFIIDESVRADHLSINGYTRPTTPWLELLQRTGKLANWGVASAAATSSDPSVVSLLTGVALPDRDGRAFMQPTIFQYAKAMGYETHLFDGQSSEPQNSLVLDDLLVLDDFSGIEQFGFSWDTDNHIAQTVRRVLNEPNGQFIVVLKRGNHIPYYDNYPLHTRVWAPARVIGKFKNVWDPEIWSEWVDSYDDGLRYNIDSFFRNMLEADGASPRTVFIYTSDHGVPYYPENDAQWWTAAAVPLLMLGDLRPAVDTNYRPSHHNLFATLLDLMQFPLDQRPFVYGRSLVTAQGSHQDTRSVFSGEDYDFSGVGHFETRDFDQLVAPIVVE